LKKTVKDSVMLDDVQTIILWWHLWLINKQVFLIRFYNFNRTVCVENVESGKGITL